MGVPEISLEPGTLHMRGRYRSLFRVSILFKQNGAPMDLTGMVFVFQIFSTNGVKMLELTNGNGITIPTQEGDGKGYIYVTITAAQMGSLNPGRYRYELEGHPGSQPQEERAYLQGDFIVSREWGT